MSAAQGPWVIVMAGGSGVRLQRVTTRSDGVTVPKQFCSLGHGRSLLQDAIGRAQQLTPRQRIVVVVAEEHEAWWRPQLADLLAENVIAQPLNRGTAVGLLLAVAHVLARDGRARVAVLPSDHYIEQPAVLMATLQRALHRTAVDRQRVFLLGITPDAPDTEYGWIVTGPADRDVHTVEQFVEKPPAPQAAELLRRGALWHSFVLAADARTLWRLGEQICPVVTSALAVWQQAQPAHRHALLAAAYGELPALDFARDLLPGNERLLGLLRVPPCGWTDLGTPERLGSCIERLLRRPAPPLPQRPTALPRPAVAPFLDLMQVVRERQLGSI
jgi:mannose-1-phosphate guanylyltransferase